jgi:pilus assembly protein CpaE
MKLIGFSKQKRMMPSVDSFLNEIGKQLIWVDSLNQLNELGEEHGILLMAISAEENVDELIGNCRKLSSEYPTFAIILISEDKNLNIRKIIRAGAFDVLTFPLNQYETIETLREAEKHVSLQRDTVSNPVEKLTLSKNARVITVCSTKGGVGKTTFTVNLAAAFAKNFKKVAVIDLDLQFGDISMFFDCNPKKTIYEWIKEGKKNTQENIKTYMYSYNEFIDIMPAPIRPEFSEAVTEKHISELLAILRPFYDVVLVDTAPYMEDKILTALEKSDEIFLLTYLDLPTLKNSKIFIETLTSLSIVQKVKVIINRDSKKKGLNSSTAEDVLGLPIFMKIPDVEKVVEVSVNEGNPYVFSNPRAKISKLIYSLALELSGESKEQPKKKSIFSRKEVSHVGRPI